MRRLVLALLLVASEAHSRVLVIVPEKPVATLASDAGAQEISQEMAHHQTQLFRILDKRHASYLVATTTSVRTEQALTGLVSINGATAEQFDGVIVTPFWGSYSGSLWPLTQAIKIRPDSAMRVAYSQTPRPNNGGPLVPWLLLMDNTTELYSASSGANYVEAVPCTTGAMGAKLNGAQSGVFTLRDPTNPWVFGVYSSPFLRSTHTVPGGVRALLAVSTVPVDFGNARNNFNWPDSMPVRSSASNDSMFVWDRQWTGLASCPNAKTMTFCSWGGAGAANDSLANDGTFTGVRPFTEGEPTILLFGLAHFDSLTGHALFPASQRKRVDIAFTVSKALSRSARYGRNAILAADTSIFYASGDSIEARGIPVTYCGNVDSAASYARDVIKIRSWSHAHFAPEVWTGISDSTKATNASFQRPVDVYGRFRFRVAVGPANGAAGDTSTYALAKAQLWKSDSLFGSQRVSRIAMPPLDDWSPLACTRASGRLCADSTLYALRRAGYSGLRFNTQSRDCYAGSSGPAKTNPRGYDQPAQGEIQLAVDRSSFKMLGHGGGSLDMGNAQVASFADSVSGGTSWKPFVETYRTWSNALWDWDMCYDTFSYDTGFSVVDFYNYLDIRIPSEDVVQRPYNPLTGGSIRSLFASDLSGNPNNPARTGWWVIKWTWNAAQAINQAAGWEMVHIGYPDEINP